MPRENMRREIISKKEADGWARGVKEFRRLAGVELFEMGLPIVSAVQSIEFHARLCPLGYEASMGHGAE